MKRKLSLFLLAFFAVAAFAAQPSKKAMVEKSYTITFQETGTESDASTALTTVEEIIDQGAEYVSEISATKVYKGRTGRGVKLGSSSAIGELKLTLAEVVKPSKIVVKARKYNDKGENYISINDNEFTLSAGDGEDCVIEYDGETEVSEIDIKTSSAKPRTYVISVSVFYSEDTGEDPVSVYTITGAVADAPYYGVEEPSFFGTAWDATVTANDLVKGEDGLYTKTYENVYLLASHFIFYQVVKDRTETLGSKKREMITSDGTYNVVFTFNPEDNSVSVALNSTAEPAPVYTLVGSVKESKYYGEQEASFFGEAWAPNFSSNDMEKGADGIYTKSFNNVQLLAQNYIEYKVVKNHDYANGEWGFGSNNANYIVTEDGEYNITFKFNPDAAFDNGYNVDVVVEKITPQPQLNTYEVYVSNVPEGFGRPYAYVWSVVDGVDVPVTAWPGTRMGPWQFDNGDMGYIFQVQAADAPQFIIFNNGQSGEGNQTADLEFVNRETYDLTELMTPPVVEDDVYTITGAVSDAPIAGMGSEEASFFGTAWDATVTANDLVKGEDGKYTKTFENVYLQASHFVMYRVVKNRTENIGSVGKVVVVSDGLQNVTFTFNPEDNSVTCDIQSAVVAEPVYTLVGGVNTTEGGQEDVLFGTTWEPTLEANDMEKGADGIYTKSFEKVALSYGDQILYKVAKNHAWSETWGFGTENADYSIQDDGEYNITFKFNPDAAFDNGYNVDVVVEKIQPVLNTYEVYVSNVPEGFGRPYAYVWSVVDGENVPVAAWPGTRMGPWQFDNGDMGYIFQVQAADAPQFIIFNNGQSGEGNQTADLEFVNRETYDLTELMTPPVVEDDVYTITGAVSDAPIAGMGSEEASFFGTAWDATVTANDLVKGEDGKYTKTFENVYLQASHFVMYRVVKNRTENIGSVGKVVVVSDGLQNVTFTFNPEDNSVTCDIQSAVVAEPVYTLVGGVNTTEGGQEDVLFGTTWEPTLEANDMEKGADGIYTKSFEKVALSYGDQILYKVAKNHAWSETWGFGTENADYSIQDDGEYNITFKFNPDAAFDNGYNVDVVVEKIQPVLNSYEVYVSNVPEGFGRPYAYVWSMVDGEAVPVAAWPGTRMGPWQFDNGDMGYIFQVQAAEAPQFIIFNNGQGGDGNQTADLEFVNRQTYDLTELMTPAVEPFDYEKIAITPADHATVESLQSFTLTFGGQVVTVNEDVFPTLAGQDGGIALNDDGSVSIDFEEAVTAPGNYTLEIPSGAILYNGTALDPLSFTYTIAGGGAEFTIEPAAGVVESLSTFVVDFGNTMLELDDDAKAYLFNEETEEEIAGSVMLIGGDKKVFVSLEEEVTAPGEYQLNIEGVKKMDGTPVELIFNYTISDGTPDQNYYILGDFWGWDNPKQMEQSADDENVYTLEMDFTAEAKAYEYKLRQGDNWEGYQLPASGNKSYTFDEAGDYTLTFTANVAEHTLDLVAVKKGEDAVYTITGAVTDHPRYGTEEAGFFGAMWDATVSANDMVKGDEGKYTKTFENVYLNAPLYILYQVVKNQTEEVGVKGTQVVETGGMYNVVFTFNPEDNNVTCELQSTVEPTPVYTLVGGVNTTEGGQEDVLFGTTWEPTLEANDMEKGADGIYTKSFEKVALSYGDQILYKVAKNHAWSETWGFGTENADYTIQDDGEYNITFKFNPDATFDNGYNVDVVVEKILPPLNTYEVYLANVPEDFGRPYAYVWSMVDGEAVPVKDWPGTRMGMWQFDNGDMGYIFQVQAAEAPQFIIFNNGQSGPLNQTVDLEFVNKQTYDLVENLIPVVDEDVLVEVPADAVIETDWHFDGIYRTSQGASDVTDNTEVAFVGNDVYVKGIPYYFTDSWMKGTISDGKAVFASGQFVGEDDYGKEYMLGYDGENIVDIVFSYDEENHIFSLETPYILENGDSKTELSMWGYYTYLDIIKGEVIPDEPVVAPADLVTEDYVFASEELSFDDNEEPVYEDYSADVKVGFDGNDVYVQGLCYYLPDSWVKGVKDGSTVTFEAGQFFGTIYDQYDMYFVGYGESGGIEDVVMNYDETTGEFTTDHWIFINSKKTSISYYNIYTSCRLTKVGPATAIQSVEDTEEAGTVYYDTLGRRTNSNTKGLLLKQVRQADGSVKTTKVARK